MAGIQHENHTLNEKISLNGLIQYPAESDATGAWQQDNLTPPTGQLPSERSAMEDIHTTLGLGGMIPGIGMPLDLADAGIYAAEGDYSQSLLALAAASPLFGLAAGGLKNVARKGAKKILRGSDELEGVAGRMPQMSRNMPRTSTYQYPHTKPQHSTYSNTETRRLKDKLHSDELDAFEEMQVRDELERLDPGWVERPYYEENWY